MIFMRGFAGFFVILLFFCTGMYPVLASEPTESIHCATGTGVQIIDESDDTQEGIPQVLDGSGNTQETGSSGTGHINPNGQKKFQKDPHGPLHNLTNDTPGNVTIQTQKNLTASREPNVSVMIEIQGIKDMIQKEREAMELERSTTPDDQQYQLQEKNDVFCAIHTLLATENLAGSIGPSVSAITGEINTSIISSWDQEEKIQNRNGISRMILGGDGAAADTLTMDITKDRLRIRGIRDLMMSEMLDDNLHDMMLEQVYTIEQELDRLEEVAHKEKECRGWLSGHD